MTDALGMIVAMLCKMRGPSVLNKIWEARFLWIASDMPEDQLGLNKDQVAVLRLFTRFCPAFAPPAP
jgi:hypothetical protein